MKQRGHMFVFGLACVLLGMTSACGPTWISKGAKYGIVTDNSLQGLRRLDKNSVVYPTVYEHMELLEDEGVVRMSRNKRFCLGTTEGKMLLECKYETILLAKGTGLAAFKKPNEPYGLMRIEDAKVLVTGAQDVALYAGQDFARIVKGKKIGIIRKNGTWMTPTVNDAVDIRLVEKEIHIFIKRGGLLGLSTPKHGQVLPVAYEQIAPFPDTGVVKITKGGRQGLANYHGQILAQPVFEEIFMVHADGAIYKQGGLYGFMDPRGKLYTEPTYEAVEAYYRSKSHLSVDASKFFAVKKNGLWGVVNSHGGIVARIQYPHIQDWIEALIVERNGKFGVISYDGQVTVPFVYDKIGTPEGGRALAYFGDKRQYVYLTPEYEQAWKRAEEEERAAREQKLREEKLQAEREAIERLERERRQVQRDIDRMSEELGDRKRELSRLGYDMTDNEYENKRRRELMNEIEELERRIEQRERQRTDLYR